MTRLAPLAALILLLSWLLPPSPVEGQGRRTPASLRGIDSLRVSYQDGRPGFAVPLVQKDEGTYVDLADWARVLGEGYTWDPENYRGGFSLDSLSVGFVLDSPLFWSGGRVAQAEAPVRYEEERVRIPVAAIDTVVLPRLRDRIRWDRSTGRLEFLSSGPWLETVDVRLSSGRLVISVGPLDQQQHRVRWDPSGTLAIEVEGVRLAPGFQAPTGRIDNLGRVRVLPHPAGVSVQVALDPGWVGLRARRSQAEKVLNCELTRSRRDLEGLGFEPLDTYPPARSRQRLGQPRRILLEVGNGGDANGAQYLQNLAAEIETALTQDFGHEVMRIADREAEGRGSSPKNRPEIPALPEADCWLGLRLERYPSTDEAAFVMVCPAPPRFWDNLDAMEGVRAEQSDSEVRESERSLPQYTQITPLTGVRPAPWGQAAREYQGASVSLAQTLADHLGVEMSTRRLRVISRPARIFRGMNMPAVLVYPLSSGDAAGARELSQSEMLSRTARSIAFGLDEYLLAHPGEP
ncbi:MAG: hypothetical protein IT349_07865 [Candidatus Eisenbacteria bacterium]|nr:hypothetical protein [Candidatus Eisenbacteria bacterium]MCC7142002.1 hypothetical protein [Candidatus Eisenbacteria bacterium]